MRDVGDGHHAEDLWVQRERVRADERARALAEVRSKLPRAAAMLAEGGCSEAWLVGSFARGDPLADSDVDLIARGLLPRTRPQLWWDLGALFGREVDLGEAERMAPERLALVLREGIRLLP